MQCKSQQEARRPLNKKSLNTVFDNMCNTTVSLLAPFTRTFVLFGGYRGLSFLSEFYLCKDCVF